MLKMLGRSVGPMRLLGIAAAATLMLSAGTARRAEALTLINPATSPATKAATDELVTQVRHGGPGGHGGGFHGGGFRGVVSIAEAISAASAAVVSAAVISAGSAPGRPFITALSLAITMVAFGTADMAATTVTGAIIVPITAIVTSTGAITLAGIIPPTIRAAAGSSGPITARAASAIGRAGTIRTAIGEHDRQGKGASRAPFDDLA